MKPTGGGYFEGILQLRDTTPEIHQWIHNRVKSDGKAAITKEKKTTNGVDFYFNDQHYLQNLGQKIRQVFPGILKTSRRLHTVDKMTSKLLYRVNVLFKPLPFKRGDIVKFRGEDVEILGVTNKVQVKNVQSGKKQVVEIKELLPKT